MRISSPCAAISLSCFFPPARKKGLVYNANLMNAYKDRHVARPHLAPLDATEWLWPRSMNSGGLLVCSKSVDCSKSPKLSRCRIWKFLKRNTGDALQITAHHAFFWHHPTAPLCQMSQNKLEDGESTGLHQSLQGLVQCGFAEGPANLHGCFSYLLGTTCGNLVPVDHLLRNPHATR